MDLRACKALPRVLCHLESFIQTTICDEDGCRTVQVIERYWVYEDDTWYRTTHLAARPTVGDTSGEAQYDPAKCAFLRSVADRLSAMTKVATAVTAMLVLIT